MTEQTDNLPLDGEVHVHGDVRVYIYRGYLAGDFDRCAVEVKGAGKGNATWVDRSKITPLENGVAYPEAGEVQ